MTTTEFIKMLQDADPNGTAHIRMEGGVPYAAELKPGYWDGPYTYIDEDKNYVFTTEGNKVDIYCKDLDLFIEEMIQRKGHVVPLDEIKKKVKINYTYTDPERLQQRKDAIYKDMQDAYDMNLEIIQSILDKQNEACVNNIQNGWTWFQNKDVDKNERQNLHFYYTWKIFDKDGKEQGSNIFNTQPVLYSGLFDRVDNGVLEGYFQWIPKPNNEPDVQECDARKAK